ncbi:MAG: sialate O-acetylesterase [Clostridia bacterium]|nr:sialate O-acetylesterase [Clostridia bacterium]
MIIQDGLQTADGVVRSFLMIGQSNMAGRGEFDEVEPIKNKSCLMLRMGRWQTMSEPINPDRRVLGKKLHSGIGLAASFADEIAKATGERIGLIPCADGGTRIAQWMPGEILYDHALFMAQLAKRSSTLAGIIWHQGESDCHTDEEMLAHRQCFTEMITALRKELGAEDLPLIIGELSEHPGEKWGLEDRPARMNVQYREIAAELPNCAVVSSEGLVLKADGIHFDSASLREFGRRYAEAYFSLLKN